VIAIDTNVLVRYFVGDDRRQFAIAKRLLENELSADEPGFVSLVVVAELAWVLRQVYRFSAEDIRQVAQRLLNAVEMEIESAKVLDSALRLNHRDVPDSLIHFIGVSAGCEKTVTFDRAFAKLDGVELLRR
jgi:predicted nucleic-acid-binding protein